MKLVLFICGILTVGFGYAQDARSGVRLEEEFSTSELQLKQVQAFEIRAVQKVHDFCNYIQLVSDKNYDEKFRTHSKKTALNLFHASTCTISDGGANGTVEGVEIEAYFDAIYQLKNQKVIGEASQINISNDLILNENGDYIGSITFQLQLAFYDQKDRLTKTETTQKEVGIVLTRKNKTFGDVEKLIWVVNLCDIRTI